MANGLLDFISTPEGQGLLSAAFGGLAGARRGTPFNNLGRAGLAGLGGYVDATDRVTQQDERAKMNQMRDLQLKQAQQQMADAEARRELAKRFAMTPGQMAVSQNGGPTLAAAQATQNTAPGYNYQGYGRALASELGDIQGALAIEDRLKKDDTPMVLADGGRLVTRTGKVLAENPKAVQEDDFIRNMRAGGIDPASPQGQALVQQWLRTKSSHAPPVSLTVDNRQEGAYRTGQGKEFSDFMGVVNKASFSAPAQIRKLERMEQLLAGVDGGKLAPTGLDIASAMASLGLKVDPKLGNKEASQALAREIAGSFRQPGAGPMTDKDFENFLLQVPDLSKTAAGRQQITKTMKAALARDIALGKKAREYEKRNGQLDSGFMDEAAQFIAENPVIGLPDGWKVQR